MHIDNKRWGLCRIAHAVHAHGIRGPRLQIQEAEREVASYAAAVTRLEAEGVEPLPEELFNDTLAKLEAEQQREK